MKSCFKAAVATDLFYCLHLAHRDGGWLNVWSSWGLWCLMPCWFSSQILSVYSILDCGPPLRFPDFRDLPARIQGFWVVCGCIYVSENSFGMSHIVWLLKQLIFSPLSSNLGKLRGCWSREQVKGWQCSWFGRFCLTCRAPRSHPNTTPPKPCMSRFQWGLKHRRIRNSRSSLPT